MAMAGIMGDSFKELLGIVLDFIKKPVETMAITLFDFLFKQMDTSFLQAINHPLLEAIVTVFSWFSWAIFIVCFPTFLVKIVYEEKRDWTVILRCFVMSLMFIYLNQSIAKLCFYAPSLVINMFGYVKHSASWEGLVLSLLPTGSGLLGSLFAIILIVALIAFGATSMMRIGAIYTQMMVAPFYVPYVLIGDNQKSMEWILSTVSISITYTIQYSLFYTGMVIVQYTSDIISTAVGLGLVCSTFAVPQQLQKYGFSSGVGRGFQSMSMPVTSIVSTMLRR